MSIIYQNTHKKLTCILLLMLLVIFPEYYQRGIQFLKNLKYLTALVSNCKITEIKTVAISFITRKFNSSMQSFTIAILGV